MQKETFYMNCRALRWAWIIDLCLQRIISRNGELYHRSVIEWRWKTSRLTREGNHWAGVGGEREREVSGLGQSRRSCRHLTNLTRKESSKQQHQWPTIINISSLCHSWMSWSLFVLRDSFAGVQYPDMLSPAIRGFHRIICTALSRVSDTPLLSRFSK